MEEKRYSGNSSMTHSADFAMEVNLRIRTSMVLPLCRTLAKEAKNVFFGQTASFHGNVVNSLLKLIDVQLEIRSTSSGKSIVKT